MPTTSNIKSTGSDALISPVNQERISDARASIKAAMQRTGEAAEVWDKANYHWLLGEPLKIRAKHLSRGETVGELSPEKQRYAAKAMQAAMDAATSVEEAQARVDRVRAQIDQLAPYVWNGRVDTGARARLDVLESKEKALSAELKEVRNKIKPIFKRLHKDAAKVLEGFEKAEHTHNKLAGKLRRMRGKIASYYVEARRRRLYDPQAASSKRKSVDAYLTPYEKEQIGKLRKKEVEAKEAMESFGEPHKDLAADMALLMAYARVLYAARGARFGDKTGFGVRLGFSVAIPYVASLHFLKIFRKMPMDPNMRIRPRRPDHGGNVATPFVTYLVMNKSGDGWIYSPFPYGHLGDNPILGPKATCAGFYIQGRGGAEFTDDRQGNAWITFIFNVPTGVPATYFDFDLFAANPALGPVARPAAWTVSKLIKGAGAMLGKWYELWVKNPDGQALSQTK